MNTTDVKKANTLKVFELVYKEKIISKLNLSNMLGISIPTVTQCITLLKEKGLVSDDFRYESAVGRKAAGITSLPNCRAAIGVELHNSYICMVAVNIYGEVFAESKAYIPHDINDQYYSLLGNAINNFFISCNLTRDKFLGVGIAIQGIPDQEGRRMIYGKLLQNEVFNLDDLKPYVAFPCTLRHDSEALADYTLWNNPEITNCIFLHLDINLGGSLIINRSAHWGKHMPSGLFEHMTLVPGGKTCYCGRKGCAECYCSSVSLLEGLDEDLDSFFRKMRQGNVDYQARWETFLFYLSHFIDNLQMAYSAEVVIAGLLASYISKEDLAAIQSNFSKHIYCDEIRPSISISPCHDNAVGAAIYYIKKFLENPMS